ncbi:ABC transporter ATP-binding protein/permease [Gilliamella sp. B3766]|nr:ABC transporter ATP-binding protein/permease [Gilliamella sp. B3722]MCX8608932.1 ABC transporter ATP-binding protein/permease [Gilliamella sp. B3771]MCX8610607.1 ABC transporter ATP-binding protein/permease [Gilliamella sp. B3891]MCX8613154.1 ABC transporter ATP-binding protein/permease [Gilliamella sp. B3773]MCX8615349.1 ABC transporter ATP-binding protein/permease [Gilliamella sp. B3770]MCX8620409.1 ABC transporter ATP-binding protein/permease [Gilliamella sp. B3892]MCX8622756.1 ABC tran
MKNIILLMKLCFKSRQGKYGYCYALIIICLNIVLIKISLEMINWNKNFFNALEKYDMQGVITQLIVFVLLTISGAITYLIIEFLRKTLVITWRKVLNDSILDKWLNNKAYWYLNNHQDEIDNPDQRISEDCLLFIERLTNEGFSLITQCIGLFSYFMLLWQITDNFVLNFSLFNIDISISHYLIWLAPIYVLFTSCIAHMLGRPLKNLLIEQQHLEANYRFALTRFRESKEPIALANGEKVEKQQFEQHFNHIIKNWYLLIKRQLILGCFTRPYYLTVLSMPIFFSLPIYLIGKVSLGSLMQISKSFSNVVTNLSWFIFNYHKLAELIACSYRLTQFFEKANQAARQYQSASQLEINQDAFAIDDLTIKKPDGAVLLTLPNLYLNKGDSVVISGASGVGKSTFFKVISGLYPNFEGKIKVPKLKTLFLSQNTYFPVGGLAHAISYPQPLFEKDLSLIKQLLLEVGFSTEFIDRNLLSDNLKTLSGGEKQRLMIARILMHKPDWIFMDETTNALDKQSEKQLLKLLKTNLPNSSFIIISHTDISNYFDKCYQLNL